MTHERVKKKNKQRASEMNLAAMLLCIVFCFLVCHFPRILLNVHEFFMLDDMIDCGAGKSFLLWVSVARWSSVGLKLATLFSIAFFFKCRFVQSSAKTFFCSANFIQNAFEWNFGDKYCFWLFDKKNFLTLSLCFKEPYYLWNAIKWRKNLHNFTTLQKCTILDL